MKTLAQTISLLIVTLCLTGTAVGFPALAWEGMTAEAATESGVDVATNVLDGSAATYWYPGNVVDRWLRIDLGAPHVVSRFSQRPRSTGNYRVQDYEIYVSDNVGPAVGSGAFFLPQAIVAWGEPVASGSFPNNADIKHVNFTPVIGRYVIIRVATAWNRPGIAQVWIHGSPFAVADVKSGSHAITSADTVEVAAFPSVEGYDHFRLTEMDDQPLVGYKDWTPTNAVPKAITFTAPAVDTNVTLVAWFTNLTESVALHSVTTHIAYATAEPIPQIKASLTRETAGSTVRITGADLDAGSSGGLFQGEPIGIFRLEAFCDTEPSCDASPAAPYVTLTGPGVYDLKLRVINTAGAVAESVSTCQVTVSAMADPPAGDRFVHPDNLYPESPYDSWANAATNIQDVIDHELTAAGHTIRVWPGIYDLGGRPAAGSTLTNRVTLDKAVSLIAVSDDPADTRIVGGWDPVSFWTGNQAVRGVYMIEGATLSGFTVTNGATRAISADDGRGGGIWAQGAQAVVSNSVIIEGLAHQFGKVYRGTYHDSTLSRAYGGDIRNAHSATLYNCDVIGRHPEGYYDGGLGNCTAYDTRISRGWSKYGGGAGGSTLFDCTLFDNQGGTGGGAATGSTLYNCIVSNNASRVGGGVRNSTVYHSVLIHNRGSNSGAGATSGTTLYNSLLIGNTTAGANGSTLYNCTVVGNFLGISGGTAVNTISWYNRDFNYINNPDLTHSSTYPEQEGWTVGNITNAPKFVHYDPNSGYGLSHVPGDYRLGPGSPATQAGLNFAWMLDLEDPRSLDLDGNPRIMPRGGTVDMGAYEREVALGTIMLIR